MTLAGPEACLASKALGAAGLSLDPEARHITLSQSGDLVVRNGPAFVKIAGAGKTAALRIRQEADALAWLSGRVRVPNLLWSGEVAGRMALVTSALPGRPLSDVAPDEAEEALAEGAKALAALHALPAEGCPGDGSVAALLAEGRLAAAEGRIDASDFHPDHRGWTPEQLIDAIAADPPPESRPVPTHGDASLPNLVWSREAGIGFVDVARLGPGDPWRDFALFLRSAERNHPGVDAVGLLTRTLPGWRHDARRDFGFRRLDELA